MLAPHSKVTDLLAELTEAAGGHPWAGGGFDAACVAVGAHIPAGDSVPQET